MWFWILADEMMELGVLNISWMILIINMNSEFWIQPESSEKKAKSKQNEIISTKIDQRVKTFLSLKSINWDIWFEINGSYRTEREIETMQIKKEMEGKS